MIFRTGQIFLDTGRSNRYTGAMRRDHPAPFRTDGTNDFAHQTMGVRIPDIISETVERNPDLCASSRNALLGLEESIRDNDPLPELKPPAPDWETWKGYARAHRGESWLDSQWFYAEHLVYRLIIEAVRYWETVRDPFLPTKEEELVSGAPRGIIERFLSDFPETGGGKGPGSTAAGEPVAAALHASLWGNRIDLSYRVSADLGSDADDRDLLVADDTERAVQTLVSSRGAGNPVHIITDNAGSELTADLLFAYVLAGSLDIPVGLHVKFHPTYVSDAGAADVLRTVNYFAASSDGSVRRFGTEVKRLFETGKIRVFPDLFWNSPGFFDDLPERLREPFSRGTMIVVKGDVNYRRAVEDAPWPPKTSLEEVLPDIGPPLLFLRSLKSDTLLQIDPAVAGKLDAEDSAWRNNGKRGVVQLSPPGHP